MVGRTGPAEHHAGRAVDVPAPPQGVVPSVSPNTMPPLPIGDGTLPQPDSPPTNPVTAGGPGAPCDIINHTSTQVSVAPAGFTSAISEPAAAVRGITGTTTVFFTHNWHAARSTDSGATFTAISPFTLFPAVDGGFCCDQRTAYAPNHDITIWFLQYIYSAATTQGSVRIAISVGANLNAGANGTWHSYLLNPSSFGIAAGNWLDFPDIVVARNHLYCASNVFSAAGSFVDAVIWKMPLAQLQAGGAVNFNFWRRTTGLGNASYRFAQGSRETMYAASHNSTTSMRAYRNDDSALGTTMFFVDRAIPAWVSGGYSAAGPNGVNWLGRIDSRITGGYANCDEYGFMWTAAQDPANGRPEPFIRIAKFSTADHTVTGTEDIFSAAEFAWAYPACASNLAGQIGYVMAVGTGNGNAAGIHPSSGNRVRDACNPVFAGGSIPLFTQGTSSPTSAVWGDYFTVEKHPVRALKFSATGMSMAGGGANANQRPRYIMFGREQDNTAWVSVGIKSTPVEGVAIVCTADNLGKTSVTTQGYASYNANAPYTLTAPEGFTSGGTVYAFCRWRWNTNPYGDLLDQALGNRVFSINSVGGQDDRAEAVYEAATRVTVGSRNPASGIAITVSRADVQGNQNGSTQFLRYYKNASGNVSFTAPGANGIHPFNRWYVNGVAQAPGLNPITIAIGASDVTVEAEYCTHTHGTISSFGSGCVGSNGFAPLLSSTSHADRGAVVRYSASRAAPNTNAALFMGFSNTTWNGTPLPLCLGFIGASNSCCILTEVFFSFPFVIDGAGNGFKDIQTSATSPIGTVFFTQGVHTDFGVPTPLKITVSNGLRTTLGGNACN
jgi:hypothetical protein